MQFALIQQVSQPVPDANRFQIGNSGAFDGTCFPSDYFYRFPVNP